MNRFDLEAAVLSLDSIFVGKAKEGRYEPLFNIHGCELVQLLDQMASLDCYLGDQVDGICWALADKRTKSRCGQVQSFRMFARNCIRKEPGIGAESLAPENHSAFNDCRDETSTGLQAIPKNHPSLQHDEESVGGATFFVNMKPAWPVRPRSKREDPVQFFRYLLPL